MPSRTPPIEPGAATGALLVSTTARMTWLWAADAPAAAGVRRALDADGHFWQPARRGRVEVANVTDIEIGAPALAACEALAAAGWQFAWHDDQPAAGRVGWPALLPGMSAGDIGPAGGQ